MKDRFIAEAYEEAILAYKENEVPVGAIIVKNNEIIAKSHNKKIKDNNIMNHAEILGIIDASRKIGDWRLSDCEMYVTLEPCPMCAGAIQQSRIKKIYIGTKSNIVDNENVIKNILQNPQYNHMVDIEYLSNQKCSNILTEFFANKR